MIKLILRGLVLTSFALGMMACNTVKGVGKDIKKAGETIEETAEKHD
ncbi:MAG: entericidin A/B family lipoprotein [Rhodanobacteraceae bacterium]|nr:entericidin A/B family lipoprotein [Rhodanobacteraceae bacterium]MBP9154779.1 entericidin A/B family lipoprotein [Xanthomonadales bacterium]HQW80672.1 entericidin A/B family lipoprotein [Pseudomonadota bacterium]